MATRLYGISRGEVFNQITEGVGAAVAADNVEVTFDLAVGLTREDVVLALQKIINHIEQGNFPPA
ncbi:MAG: hypothetical protein ACYC5T_10005 [Thiobacillus sp.]